MQPASSSAAALVAAAAAARQEDDREHGGGHREGRARRTGAASGDAARRPRRSRPSRRRCGPCDRFGGLGTRSFLAMPAATVAGGDCGAPCRPTGSLPFVDPMVIVALILGLALGAARRVASRCGAARSANASSAGTPSRSSSGRRRLGEVRDASRPAARQTLQRTSSSFLEIARLQTAGYVTPLKESLEKRGRPDRPLELAREEAYGAVRAARRAERPDGGLETGLAASARCAAGWGEVQLRNVSTRRNAAALRLSRSRHRPRRRRPAASDLSSGCPAESRGRRREGPARAYRVSTRVTTSERARISRRTLAQDVKRTSTRSRRSTGKPFERTSDFAFMFLPDETVYTRSPAATPAS